ncbi:polyubiquitin-like isoform X2 [Triticum aestivum]|uniref:polyubiquitin-like isoform X2 n=1 Tax=Triticum aestivum TaxID=4565 RepID=UPI001D028E89|nr:polyubiquitin-like isoform X2 [Triticum aestivum]
MKLFVETLAGKKIAVKVDPSDTINVVKAKIHEQQRLTFDDEDLDDTRSVAYYRIHDGSTLRLGLRPRRKIEIFVKGLAGKTTTHYFEELDTVDCVKAMIQESDGMPADEQRLIHAGETAGRWSHPGGLCHPRLRHIAPLAPSPIMQRSVPKAPRK